MPDLDELTRRLAALPPERREQVESELRRRGVALPEGLRAPSGFAREPTPGDAGHHAVRRAPATFSVFFFSAQSGDDTGYRLVMEAAQLADRRGFEAVWTPERHFHSFGGPYPAPVLLAAALAPQTERIGLRAGSLVLPLHDPIRVAEEWAVVDNLSGGRAGIAMASGFHPTDFVFAPEAFARRREVLKEHFDRVRRLWRGEPVRVRTPVGESEITTYPRPVQPELPIWLTASGENDSSFEAAGELGVNVLTALLNQNVEQLERRIARYRAVLAEHGHDPATRKVTVMIHTFVGADTAEVREIVREPFREYLRTHLDLARSLAAGLHAAEDISDYAEHEDDLLEFGFHRYVDHASLMGDARHCDRMIDSLEAAGVDEIAALIDFGVAPDLVLGSLERLAELRERRLRDAYGTVVPSETARGGPDVGAHDMGV
ncbi:LLM class flavin-dependent oxidoreductase [Nonomuraea sp. KC401]|uniref:MupA/Atu3671 family FMN-dependent luciferase-like monooxygenase n=1 Tax=unclassified Nonomuraea TaxID=2593643 RepID=UPI0010FCFA99|nr:MULTISPECIES: MupA/Atu3671 family FMN-dependent luciferase-like monooxygenase [unclassified Nonomuraea]NBF00425.1 LLM class flavin-dependent oxidoreductase [Nonomuraea sp. K271]TLF48776.1 LLM class flavin-dependent oxidoreductase [Nonomuraea sp. KC401]